MTATEKFIEDILKQIAILLKDKPMLMTELSNFTAKLQQHSRGLKEMAKLVEQGSDENAKKQLRNCMLTTSLLCENVVCLNLLAITYSQGTFDKDGMDLAMKAGADPKTVLQHIINSKR